MTRRKAWIPHLGLLLLAMSIIAILALLYYASKTAQPPPQQPPAQIQPPQPAQPPQNITQPQPPETPKPKPPTITATIEASQGGRVLANGTETAVWSFTKPFTLLLKAVPDTCYAFDHWEVNGEEHSGPDLALAIAGNTTVKAIFTRPLYTVTINTNATGAAAQINGENYTLPTSLRVPACSTVEVKPLETPLYKPLNTTLKITVEGDASITLRYWAKTQYPVQVLINGKPQYVEARDSPFFKGNGTVEMQGDWIHIKGDFSIYIYIPWNLTHIIVEARNVNGTLIVMRLCEWGADPFAYGKMMGEDVGVLRVEFEGCRVVGYAYYGYVRGKRYECELPGALRIDLTGEAWVRITAYP
jgi:hypothetical protein